MGNVQFIRGTPRKSKFRRISDALVQGLQGYQQGQDRQMAIEQNNLANLKTRAEMEKMAAELSLLQAQAKLFNNYASTLQNQEPIQENTSEEDDMINQKIAELEAELQQATVKPVQTNVKRGKILSQDEDVLGLGL